MRTHVRLLVKLTNNGELRSLPLSSKIELLGRLRSDNRRRLAVGELEPVQIHLDAPPVPVPDKLGHVGHVQRVGATREERGEDRTVSEFSEQLLVDAPQLPVAQRPRDSDVSVPC